MWRSGCCVVAFLAGGCFTFTIGVRCALLIKERVGPTVSFPWVSAFFTLWTGAWWQRVGSGWRLGQCGLAARQLSCGSVGGGEVLVVGCPTCELCANSGSVWWMWLATLILWRLGWPTGLLWWACVRGVPLLWGLRPGVVMSHAVRGALFPWTVVGLAGEGGRGLQPPYSDDVVAVPSAWRGVLSWVVCLFSCPCAVACPRCVALSPSLSWC